MLQRISNSWELFQASARVLSKDKELLLFPVISFIALIVVSAIFFIPMAIGGILDSLFSEDFGFFSLVPLFLFYIVQYFVIFFSNTALVGAALIRLRGGDPTLRDGFRIAASHFGPILGYALIAATVGIILKAASERNRGLTRFVVNLIGMAWNIGTYLVVPILAVEDVGPIDAIKRSVELLKKTWGEQIAGNFGLGAISAIVSIGLVGIGGAFTIFAISAQLDIWVIVIVLVILVFALMLLALVNSTLTGIYTAAVYQYAADGQLESYFEPDLIQSAFTSR